MDKKIVVLGAGPCGLGACARLQQLGHKNWTLVDKNDFTGGLAGSFLDREGFLWDVGVHVMFSHYQYFNDLIDQGVLSYAQNIGDRHSIPVEETTNIDSLWMTHKRECWIRFTPKTWISYPFQNNFFYLNESSVTKECINGLLAASDAAFTNKPKKFNNFHDLIMSTFGDGLAKHFMLPYNLKVWGYPATKMNAAWVGERVAMPNLNKIVDDYVEHASRADKAAPIKECGNWGPNSVFKYPKYGGTGSIWKGVGNLLDETKVKLNTEVVEIDAEQRVLKLANGESIQYDYLISTIPIDILIEKQLKPSVVQCEELYAKHGRPLYSSTNVIGLGFDGAINAELRDKSWMYFQSDRSPFYRMTAFSNYSPYLVAKPYKQSSLLFEVCETSHLPGNLGLSESEMIEKTVQGCLAEGFISQQDVDNIVSRFHMRFEYGYPTPYVTRDAFLNDLEPVLRNKWSIYSRGRFGGWKYEVSNQDHSLMQGVEAVDNILFGAEEQTYFYPDHVNSRKETTRRFKLSN